VNLRAQGECDRGQRGAAAEVVPGALLRRAPL